MGASTGITVPLGAVAVVSSTALATLDIIFADALSRSSSPQIMRVTAIVASAVGTVAAILCLGLLIRQMRCQGVMHMHDSGNRRKCTYVLVGLAAMFSVLSDVASAMMLGIMKTRMSDTPPTVIMSSTEKVIHGGLAVWTISVISQGIFVASVVVTQRGVSREQAQPYRAASRSQARPEMEKIRSRSDSNARKQEVITIDTGSSPSLQGKTRSGSDAMASFRSSWTNDRSVTSQTKLISSKTLYQSASLDDISKPAEDGFDSWDTSAVDPDAREAVELASPSHPTLLETIPASPATSRSPSPGYPLDLEPPKQRKKGRKYSLPNNHEPRPKTSPSKIENMGESHIHPLFRAASTEPPPSVTPGTVVTAAPGAGRVILHRSSLRPLQRKWSDDLLSSSLKHSHSLDNFRWPMGYEEDGTPDESGERTMTPPIPDWIMTAGSRSSLAGYNSRRKSEAGVAPEDVEAI